MRPPFHMCAFFGCGLIAAFNASLANGVEQASTAIIRPVSFVETTNEDTRLPVAAQPAAALQPAPEQSVAPSLPAATHPRPRAHAAAGTRPHSDAPVPNQARPVLDFYGGASARATLSQMPRRAPIQPGAAPPPQRRPVKPFQSVYEEPTISPYLNLHREEHDAVNAPNYYAFVRPQLEQIETNRRQQLEIQRLRAQLQGMPSNAPGPQQNRQAGTPGGGTAARYMDTAQFYSGWPR